MKSPKQRNKAQRKLDYKNYDAITMSRYYEEKLLQEIMRRNFDRKLSAMYINDSENVGIIEILAYPKIKNLKRFKEYFTSGCEDSGDLILPNWYT